MGNTGVKLASLSELERAVEHVNALCSSGLTLGGNDRRLFYGLRVELRLRGNQGTSRHLRVLWRNPQFVRVIITPIAPPPISVVAQDSDLCDSSLETALDGALAPKIATVAQFEELYALLVRVREGIILGRERHPIGGSSAGKSGAVADPGSNAGNKEFDPSTCRSVASAGAALLRDAFWRDTAADAIGDCGVSADSDGTGDKHAAEIDMGKPKVVHHSRDHADADVCGDSDAAGNADADADSGAGADAGADAGAVVDVSECDDEEYPDSECPICMDNVVEIVLPCSHSFCRECAVAWQQSAPTAGVHMECPLCRGESDGSGAIPAEWELTEAEEVLNATASHVGDLARTADTFVRRLPSLTADS